MDAGHNAGPVMTALLAVAGLAAVLTVAGKVYAQVGPAPARGQAMAQAARVSLMPIARLAAGAAPVAGPWRAIPR